MLTVDKVVKKTVDLVSDRHTRSMFFLVITAVIIFLINGLLPTIEGKAHYTADPVTVTYAEYLEMKETDANYALTWGSESDIMEYKLRHNADDIHLVEIPDNFSVSVYTKFFFQHPFWYITTLVRIVSAVVLFYSIFNYLLTRYKDTHKRYVSLTEELVQLSNNSLDPSTFEPWMEHKFNHDRKVAQHIANVKYKLGKLEQKTSYKIRILAKKDPTNRKCLRYLHRREDLQSRLDIKYIEEVVVNKGVKRFKHIHPTFVTCGSNRVGHTTDSYSLIESDNSRLSKDMMSKIVLSTFLTLMFTALLTITVVTAADKPWYWVVIDVLTTIAPLLLQVPTAFDYCNTYMEDHLIPNLLNRRTIALLYLADMQKGVTYEKNSR